jgi:hypothetical protein
MEEKAAQRDGLTRSLIAAEVASSKLSGDAGRARSATGGLAGEPSGILGWRRGVHVKPRSGRRGRAYRVRILCEPTEGLSKQLAPASAASDAVESPPSEISHDGEVMHSLQMKYVQQDIRSRRACRSDNFRTF